jgi:hypothetical protein
MVNKERDSKFIIYQVLYIFVITVLAIKGADLNLRKVVSKDKVVSKSVRDSLMVLIDSLNAKGINFEIKINPLQQQNSTLKEQVALLNEKVKSLTEKIQETPAPSLPPQKPEVKEQTILQSPIALTQTFLQNTWNIAKNNGSVPTSIYDPQNQSTPIVVIPPGQERKFNLGGQTEVIAKFGNQQERINVVPKRPTQIKIERATTKMEGSTIYVQDLQRNTVYNVTIKDQRPDQLKISYVGPISVTGPYKNKEGDLVYNVSLKLATTQDNFDNWLDHNTVLKDSQGRYKVNFFFTALDEITKQKVQAGESIYFTDFSR